MILLIKKRAVTLVEVLIASLLLAAFMTSLFMVFRSGSKTFEAGNWRVQHQKMLQNFFTRLRDYMEKANYAHKISAGGVNNSTELPICVNSSALDKPLNCRNIDADLLFWGVTEPNKSAQPEYGVSAKTGSWYGVALLARKGKLILRANGDWNILANGCNPPADIKPADLTAFPANNKVAFQTTLDNVESVEFTLPSKSIANADKDNDTFKIKITLRRYDGGRATPTSVTEEIVVKLIEKDHKIKKI